MDNAKTDSPKPAQARVDFPLQVYRPSGGWRAFLLIVSLLLGGFSVAGVWYFGTMHEVHSVRGAVLFVGICIAFLLLSSLLVAVLFLSRVILSPDSIESRELFSRGKLSRDEILGRRLQENPRGPASLVLVPRDSSAKRLKFATFYNFDETFWGWVESLPDLDEKDKRATQQEIFENAEIGATREDRLSAAKEAKRVATFLTVVACATGAWGWFYPQPYWLLVVLLVLLPWIAVAITMHSGGLFRIDSKKNDPHPTVAVPFLLPGCVLALRAINDVNLLGWRAATYASFFVGFVLAATAIIADRSLRTQKGAMVGILLLSIFYGYGASVETNTILDRSATTVFSAQVVRKEVVSGKRTSYNLYLSPWGPEREQNEVSVSQRWYESLQPGDAVCPALREGALHIRWYTVRPCPKL